MLNPSALENSHAASKLAASMGIAIHAVDAWSLSRSQVDNLLAQNTGHGCRRTLRLDAADMCSENLTIWESKQLIQRRARKSGTIARDPLSGSINNAWPACCCPTTRAARTLRRQRARIGASLSIRSVTALRLVPEENIITI